MHDEIACRFHTFPFHAFSSIATFAATATTSPKCSLSSSVILHLEDGMRIYNNIPAEFASARYKVSRYLERLADASLS